MLKRKMFLWYFSEITMTRYVRCLGATFTEVYLDPSRISRWSFSAKIVNGI